MHNKLMDIKRTLGKCQQATHHIQILYDIYITQNIHNKCIALPAVEQTQPYKK